MRSRSSTLRISPHLHPRTILPGIMDELAAELGFNYECASADIDEQAIRHEDPHQLVRQLAAAKADAIASRLASQGTAPSGLLITCDQVVVHRDRILEKPRDEAEVREGCGPHIGLGSEMSFQRRHFRGKLCEVMMGRV